MVLSYWLFLTGVIFLAGALFSRFIVTGPSGADVCVIEGGKRCFGETASVVIFLSALFTFVFNLIHLVFHASVMTETPLTGVFPILPIFLVKTKYGQLILIRTILLLPLIIVAFLTIRRPRLWLALSGIALSFSIVVTLSISGHQGVNGYFNLPVVTDTLHITAAAPWIGGIFFIRLCYSFLLKAGGRDLWGVFPDLINRFSNLATYCVYVAGVTGIVLVFFRVKDFEVLTGTT
ncbi:MAG TPA: hypothetical protein ENH07_01805 [Nitrospirae bacterium]|nr:hypothetical protein [Nitrospirota bacterium]HDY71010.1 hypothetical protein [Nitrospirota bacterium]